MEVVVVPVVDEPVRRALEVALDDVWVRSGPSYADAWRQASLHEGVMRDDEDPDYALSPRRTRGATRA